ncbi:DUF2860 family protein [Deltaproteobacteria bacterium TL4]
MDSDSFTAKIIVTHSKRITQIAVNGKIQDISPANSILFETLLSLNPGENRVVIEAEDETGAKADKLFLIYHGSPEEIAAWKHEKEREGLDVIFFMLDLRLRYDDNPLLNSMIEIRAQATNEGTSALYADFTTLYRPTTWKWGSVPVTPELSYRFQAQVNSTSKTGGYLSHWFSGKLDWELKDSRVDLGFRYVTLQSGSEEKGWQDLAGLQIVELSGVKTHSARFQSRPFLVYINQNFNDDLEVMKAENDQGNDLDGIKWLGGYSLDYYLVPERQQIEGKLVYTSSDTRLDYEDYSGTGVMVDYRILISDSLRFSIKGQYEVQTYEVVNPVWDETRLDQFTEVTLKMSYELTPNILLTWDLSRFVNVSNIDVYDYERHLFDIGTLMNF